MSWRRRRRERDVVCVEISQREIRALRVRLRGAKRAVEGYERHPLPPGREGPSKTALVEGLLKLSPLLKEGAPELRLVLGGPSVFLRNVLLPPMPRAEVASAIRFRWPEFGHTPLDQLQMDLAWYGSQKSPGGAQTEVLVAGIEKQAMGEWLEVFGEAGLQLAAIIPASVALQQLRCAELRERNEPPSLEAIFDIGASRACLILVKGERLLMAREFSTAGDAFTQILQRELEVGEEEAEKLKITHGVVDPGASPAHDVDPSVQRSILTALRPMAERLVSEVQRSVAFTQENRGEGAPKRVLLTGGGGRLRGLDGMLAEALGAPVEIWPPAGLGGASVAKSRGEIPGPDGGETPASWAASPTALCLGAALRPSPINFLSLSPLLSARRRPRPGPLWLALGYALALAAAVGWLWQRDRALEQAVAQQEARLSGLALSGEPAAIDPYLLGRAREAVNFKVVFDALDRLVLEGVRFESIAFKRPQQRGGGATTHQRELRVEGTTHGEPAKAESTLARFLESVEASPVFENVQLVLSIPLPDKGERGLRFAFTCELSGEGDADQSGLAGANIPGGAR